MNKLAKIALLAMIAMGVGECEDIMSLEIDYHRPSTGSEQYCFRPLFGIPEAYLCPNIKNRLYG